MRLRFRIKVARAERLTTAVSNEVTKPIIGVGVVFFICSQGTQMQFFASIDFCRQLQVVAVGTERCSFVVLVALTLLFADLEASLFAVAGCASSLSSAPCPSFMATSDRHNRIHTP